MTERTGYGRGLGWARCCGAQLLEMNVTVLVAKKSSIYRGVSSMRWATGEVYKRSRRMRWSTVGESPAAWDGVGLRGGEGGEEKTRKEEQVRCVTF